MKKGGNYNKRKAHLSNSRRNSGVAEFLLLWLPISIGIILLIGRTVKAISDFLYSGEILTWPYACIVAAVGCYALIGVIAGFFVLIHDTEEGCLAWIFTVGTTFIITVLSVVFDLPYIVVGTRITKPSYYGNYEETPIAVETVFGVLTGLILCALFIIGISVVQYAKDEKIKRNEARIKQEKIERRKKEREERECKLAEESDARIAEYSQILTDFSGGKNLQVTFIIDGSNEMKGHEQFLKRDFAEKISSYKHAGIEGMFKIVIFDWSVKSVRCFESIEMMSSDIYDYFALNEHCKYSAALDVIVGLTEVAKETEDEKNVFEIYTAGGGGYSLIYSHSFYSRIMNEMISDNEKYKVNFNINETALKHAGSDLWVLKDGKTICFDKGIYLRRMDNLTDDMIRNYHSHKARNPGYIILNKSSDELGEISALNEDALILAALLMGECKGPYIRNVNECRSGYGRTKNVVHLQVDREIVEFELKAKELNYVLADGEDTLYKRDFGDKYQRFVNDIFANCGLTWEEIAKLWTLQDNKSGDCSELYYDDGNCTTLEFVKRKPMSYWSEKYPDSLVFEILENRVDSPVRINTSDAKKVLYVIAGQKWDRHAGFQMFGMMQAMEEAELNYAIIAFGKVAFEGHFENGKENIARCIEEYSSRNGMGKSMLTSGYRKPGRIKIALAESKYPERVKKIKQELLVVESSEKDHFIAHEMKKYRRWENQPKLAIRLFDDFKQNAGDCMYTSVAAAYNDIGDKDKAIKFLSMASDNEYTENVREKILRGEQSY